VNSQRFLLLMIALALFGIVVAEQAVALVFWVLV
jgi:hypothetical protein